MGPCHLLVFLWLMAIDAGIAFTTTPAYLTQLRKRGEVKIRIHREGHNEDSQSDQLSNRTCIRQLLTQRSIQSFLFLLSQCRDPHTVRWIEEFGGSNNLSSYHGTGALTERFLHWDDFFNEIILKPIDVVQVEVHSKGRPSGMSANNPFREKEEQVRDYGFQC